MKQQTESTTDSTAATSLDRRSLIVQGAKAAAGIAAGSALLGPAAGTALAEQARPRTFQILKKATVTLTVLTIAGPAELALYKQRAQVFEARNPNIKVNFNLVAATSWAQFAEKIVTIIAGGNVPDIFRVATEAVQPFGSKNLLYSLNDFIKRDAAALEPYYKGVYAGLIDSFKYKGQQTGLPFDCETEVIIYNTALFQKLGIKPPPANWTIDDFVTVAKKVKAAGPYAINLPTGGTFALVAWMYAAGGGLMNSTLTKSTATLPANVAAMQFLQDLVYKYKVAPQPNAGLQDFPLLEAGRVGMVEDGRWGVATFNQAKFSTYNCQYLPMFSTGQRKSIFGLGSFGIYKGTKYPEQAWEWVKFITSHESSQFFVQSGQGVSPWRDIALNPKLMNPPANFQAFYHALESGLALPAPTQYNETDTALTTAYTKVMANEMTAAAAMKQLDQQLTSILRSPA